MRASELISKLEVLIEKHGDLMVSNDDGQVITDAIKTSNVYRDYIELGFFGWNVFEE